MSDGSIVINMDYVCEPRGSSGNVVGEEENDNERNYAGEVFDSGNGGRSD